MSRLGAAFSRLSRREKIMVGALAVVLVGGLLFFLTSMFQGKINRLEADIATAQDSLRKIYAGTSDYLSASTRFEETRAQAEKSASLTLTTAVSTLADAIVFDAADPRTATPVGKKHLKEFLEFGALKEKPVGARKKETKPSASKKEGAAPGAAAGAGGGYMQRDQEFTIKGTVPFVAVYELFEKVEEADERLFVTDVKLERNAAEPDRADNVKFTVSTVYFVKDEPAEETP